MFSRSTQWPYSRTFQRQQSNFQGYNWNYLTVVEMIGFDKHWPQGLWQDFQTSMSNAEQLYFNCLIHSLHWQKPLWWRKRNEFKIHEIFMPWFIQLGMSLKLSLTPISIVNAPLWLNLKYWTFELFKRVFIFLQKHFQSENDFILMTSEA